MKEFIQVLRRFVPPYKKYLILHIIFNVKDVPVNSYRFLQRPFLVKTQKECIIQGASCGYGNLLSRVGRYEKPYR